jgi:hypothetical protein
MCAQTPSARLLIPEILTSVGQQMDIGCLKEIRTGTWFSAIANPES